MPSEITENPADIDVDALADLLAPGCRVAVSDGVGTPIGALPALAGAARRVGDVELLLGWHPVKLPGLDPYAFSVARSLMIATGLGRWVAAGAVRYLPTRLGTVPALLAGPLRVDVLLASLVTDADGGYRFGTEASWLPAAVAAGARVAGVLRPSAPSATREPALPPDVVTLVGVDPARPVPLRERRPTPQLAALGAHVAALVPAGARLQFAPGAVGDAVVDALEVPVHVDSGAVTDAVPRLAERGLLLGHPIATYLTGSAELYRWADGRRLLAGVQTTHDPARLGAGPGLVAVNTALEVDLTGQSNVETSAGVPVGGIGGQPDFAAAAANQADGLSVIALPATMRDRPTLVERLSAPPSAPRHDVEVIVTEHGAADLRGLDDAEKAAALTALWAPVR